MRIVTASTPEQHKYVKEMVTYFFESLFPFFFSSSYREDLKNFGVLELKDLEEFSLKEILEITAALQTLQSLMECMSEEGSEMKHSKQFERNTKILTKHSIYFPFNYDDFSSADGESLYMAGKAYNQWII
ncbi:MULTISPECIES: DUF5365 family protein [Pontibacillus]|uniref:DUF5365 family protein n=1 Tax=Pontibacillus chungwhensis TaxID=265426 RepID=A0ABY8USX1_9BACI|nr:MULTISPECIES: DUF5365 family protein [Pontibacillus]MCD5322917.1 YhcU family protein [Pontibacillus sp. HN14]WIF96313.1 DUF5365 family protein [Pontibacillus chungwhensis]